MVFPRIEKGSTMRAGGSHSGDVQSSIRIRFEEDIDFDGVGYDVRMSGSLSRKDRDFPLKI